MFGAVAALWWSYGRLDAPYITNDGYQYLDAATNLMSEECLCTRVAVFDEQVAFGHMPIPFTHFAPAYPLLIAAISRTGITAERAGYLISATAFVVTLWLIWDVALVLGLNAWLVAAISLMWISHAAALFYGSMVAAESLFTALVLALAALITRDITTRATNRALPLAVGIVAGISYWVRYPGIFLVAGAAVYLIVRAWRTPGSRLPAVGGLIAAALFMALIQIRNMLYTGSWRGGFEAGGRNSLRTGLTLTLKAFFHIVHGDRIRARLDLPTAVLFLSLVAILLFAIEIWRNPPAVMKNCRETLGWILFIAVTYTAGILLATATTIAADLPRYYFPLYALLLVITAIICSSYRRRAAALATIALAISSLAIQGRNLLVAPPVPDWVLTRTFLAEEVAPGVSLLEWLQSRLTPDEVIVAVEGQAVHYILHRPVVAVISTVYTHRPTDEAAFHALMRQYRSKYLLLFPGAPAERVPEQNSYAFLRTLPSGGPPEWLKFAVGTRTAAIYECTDCAARTPL